MTIKTQFQANTVHEWMASLQTAIHTLHEMEADASGDTKLFLKVVIAAIEGLIDELADNLTEYEETRRKDGGTRK